MPEGPEVETIRRGLEVSIVGQTIADVDVRWPGSLVEPVGVARTVMLGAVVRHVARRAKVLLLELDRGYTMMFHLKMTGQMVLVKADGERYAGGHPSLSMREALPDGSTRLVFGFASGDRLFFNDQRKFGWMKLVPTAEVGLDPLVARLGPEVLSAEFTAAYLGDQLRRHARAPVKAVILDQSTVGGIGNIYADESLHLARIHPARLAGSLTLPEVRRLQAATRDIMTAGIEHGGTSFAHYVNSLGGTGDYLEHARVFRRQGLPCAVCGTVIEKIRVAGRGTHVCPKCQRL
ncbi:MAG TPA: bifunctional DNA-formamidopyrimidine glycosylase/DNA-(apurinic or apyrimidinic site) lyase [Candidatus Saccharimonadia bacterium]|nr:bifunctional DNA-formamidopyrimidine glycosylase/DNA-(apurinic or apyrimidinic site) lyase [Candidatus Saccharimonadia bacterium]